MRRRRTMARLCAGSWTATTSSGARLSFARTSRRASRRGAGPCARWSRPWRVSPATLSPSSSMALATAGASAAARAWRWCSRARARVPTGAWSGWPGRAVPASPMIVRSGRAPPGPGPSRSAPMSSSTGSRPPGGTPSDPRLPRTSTPIQMTTSPRPAPARATRASSARKRGLPAGRLAAWAPLRLGPELADAMGSETAIGREAWRLDGRARDGAGTARQVRAPLGLLEPEPAPLFLDQLLTALEVPVPHRAVEVDRGVLEALVEIEVERALVERVSGRHAQLVPKEGDVVVERVDGAVRREADAIAHGQRRQEREHQVGAGPDTPLAERLSEVGPLGLEGEFLLRDVEEAPHAQGRVDQETAHLDRRALQLPLQHLVHEALRHVQVGEGVVDHLLDDVGRDRVVRLRRRLEDALVEAVVEREDLLVELLPRVVLLDVVVRRSSLRRAAQGGVHGPGQRDDPGGSILGRHRLDGDRGRLHRDDLGGGRRRDLFVDR